MNEMAHPREIEWFETIQIVSVAIGLVNQFATPAIGWLDATFGALCIVGLTLLISRGRKNWARWVLTILVALGLALVIFFAPAIIENGVSILSIAVWLLQAAGIALLFTRSSSNWLSRPSPPVTAE